MCQPTGLLPTGNRGLDFQGFGPRAFAFRLGCGDSHNQEEEEHHHDHLFQWEVVLFGLGFDGAR